MKSTLDKLYEQREENEKEREIIEREKLDLVNLNEQIIGILINIENIKKKFWVHVTSGKVFGFHKM